MEYNHLRFSRYYLWHLYNFLDSILFLKAFYLKILSFICKMMSSHGVCYIKINLAYVSVLIKRIFRIFFFQEVEYLTIKIFSSNISNYLSNIGHIFVLEKLTKNFIFLVFLIYLIVFSAIIFSSFLVFAVSDFEINFHQLFDRLCYHKRLLFLLGSWIFRIIFIIRSLCFFFATRGLIVFRQYQM